MTPTEGQLASQIWDITLKIAIPTASAVIASVLATARLVTKAEVRFALIERDMGQRQKESQNQDNKLDDIQKTLNAVLQNCASHGYQAAHEMWGGHKPPGGT